MAKNQSTAVPKDELVKNAVIAQLFRNLQVIGTAVLAIRNLADSTHDRGDPDGAIAMGVSALTEQAGYLTDKCLHLIGQGPGICGDFDDWAVVDVPQSEEASHA